MKHVRFHVDEVDSSNQQLYNTIITTIIEIKKIHLQCDANVQNCVCHVMIDINEKVIACAFYRVTERVYIEIVCVKTIRQRLM